MKGFISLLSTTIAGAIVAGVLAILYYAMLGMGKPISFDFFFGVWITLITRQIREDLKEVFA